MSYYYQLVALAKLYKGQLYYLTILGIYILLGLSYPLCQENMPLTD